MMAKKDKKNSKVNLKNFSPAARDEIKKWQADPKKYWWEHSGKKTLYAALALLAIALTIIILVSY
jgi:hypothetical protein